MTDFFCHEKALVESTAIGSGTRIWAFAHVLPGARVGSDCNICDHVFIENDVVVGDRVTIKSGVQLWDGIELKDDVFIGPNATFSSDRFPRSKRHQTEYPKTVIHQGASVGANATVLPGIQIGRLAMVGAGSVVTRNVPPFAVVAGNPARIVRYVEDAQRTGAAVVQPSLEEMVDSALMETAIKVEGVRLIKAPIIHDLRGNLSAREVEKGLPFMPQRTFIIFDVPTKEVRGEHAHRVCAQFFVCVKGSVRVLCDDGKNRQDFHLTSSEIGLFLPPMVWGVQYHYSPDAMLLVYASERYDPGDYIRDYEDFLAEKAVGSS
jgi:UDP-2-acetamido-3-amino-2,3-dideoxy-glucuronate N-acetyltransferase